MSRIYYDSQSTEPRPAKDHHHHDTKKTYEEVEIRDRPRSVMALATHPSPDVRQPD